MTDLPAPDPKVHARKNMRFAVDRLLRLYCRWLMDNAERDEVFQTRIGRLLSSGPTFESNETFSGTADG
jgi:hypothetical protein